MKYPLPVGKTWLNSKPLDKDDLSGKVVLFDFWTFSCSNCLHTLPYLRLWWDKYKNKDFIIIGIHTPEFDFERELPLLEAALREFGVTWPVLLDNDLVNWRNFANRYWPAKYLCDQNGNIIYSHFGEGEYELTERKIQEAIRNNLGLVDLPPIDPDEVREGEPTCILPTPELYCGYKRGVYSNVGEYQYDSIINFDPPDIVPPNTLALEGWFNVGPEYVEATQHGAKIWLNFQATEVNIVMGPTSWGAVVDLELDGSPLDESIMGRHVNPASKVEFYRPAMYNIIKSSMPVRGVLKVIGFEWSPPFRAYAFTFSGCLNV